MRANKARLPCRPWLRATAAMRVEGLPDVWTAGDCAAVPDLINPGKFCPPNAQHALRQGNHIGDNLAKVLRSSTPTEYKHKNIGAVASLGMYKGVAQMFGRIKVRGFLAWVLHRSYHVMAMPTLNRKVRIAAGWTGSYSTPASARAAWMRPSRSVMRKVWWARSSLVRCRITDTPFGA